MTERPYTPEVDSLVWQYRGRRTVAADLVRRVEEAVRLDVAIRESRETIDDGTLVRIQAPRFTTYGDKTAPRPWTLEEVETIVYRLRMAGGQDDTEVRFKHEHTEATVPFPEYALEPVQRTTAVDTNASLKLASPRWLVAVNAMLVSRGVVLILVTMVIGIVVGVVVL